MTLVRANALSLPLRDESVDLVVTSPPYFALRSYQDGGEHYDGQIGSEDTPAAFLAALWAVLDECWRVLKPTGSVFVNLGDKYAGSSSGSDNGALTTSGLVGTPSQRLKAKRTAVDSGGLLPKSLMLLPEQFRLGAVDPQFRAWKTGVGGPQWIARSVVIWDKPNGLPESVTDRVRRSHEDWVHLTKQGRYFAAVDEIREPTVRRERPWEIEGRWSKRSHDAKRAGSGMEADDKPLRFNPLGKLPGSVWEIPSEPLKVPDWLGVDHFAAYPQEWPRRIILGWTPTGWCTACGEPRRAVVEKTTTGVDNKRKVGVDGIDDRWRDRPGARQEWGRIKAAHLDRITGYACGCPDTTAPTRPAVVLDPFGGTGTTAMVARALGRYPVHVDLSADYLRLARWRIYESGHAAKTLRRTNEEAQLSLLA